MCGWSSNQQWEHLEIRRSTAAMKLAPELAPVSPELARAVAAAWPVLEAKANMTLDRTVPCCLADLDAQWG